MNTTRQQTQSKPAPALTPAGSVLLQRKCACGNHTIGGGDCRECGKKKRFGLQTKLKVNEPGDIYEQEADRIADQVLATPVHPSVSGAPPRIQRFSGPSNAQMDAAPASVDQALASPGSPLEPTLRQDMERRFGHDFSSVRVHSDGASGRSARHVNAHAYTSGYDIVFGAGRFAPGTVEGRRLLAHELTHVVQQTAAGGGWAANFTAAIQRDVSGVGVIPAPDDLLDMYRADYMLAKRFDRLADHLLLVFLSHPTPNRYVREVIKAIASDDEDDQLGAAFVKRLPEPKLDQMAATSDGRATLNILYEAIITGDVTEFEREQANRIIATKLRRKSPEDYIKGTKRRSSGAPTPIFPVRFMRVTGGAYAPPLAKLMPNGHIHVEYPNQTKSYSMFKEELRTLGDVFGAGMDLNPSEIVGIKDYEKGGGVQYLPALALIDYSNQAIESTSGKIIEVSLTVATLGIGGGAAAGRAAAKELVTSTAIWGARLGKAAHVLDRAATVIEIASFVIKENRDWIISKLGEPGKRLVQLSDVASSAVAIYGIVRLGQAGYGIVKDMRTASKAARELRKPLTQAEAATLQRLDDETDLMLKQLDEEAAKSGRAAAPTPAEKPAVSGRVDEPVVSKAPTKAEPAKAHAGGETTSAKPTKAGGDAAVSAKYTTPDGEVIKITKDREIWICTNPCDRFAQSYHAILEKNKDLAAELEHIRKIADPKAQAEALGALKLKADRAPIKELQGLATDGSYRFVMAGKARRGNALRLHPDDWNHILEGHVKLTFDASKRGASTISTVFKGTPAQYLEILEEAVKNKAVIRELNKGNSVIRLKLRNQEWMLQVDLTEGAVKTFHATGAITNKQLFEVIKAP